MVDVGIFCQMCCALAGGHDFPGSSKDCLKVNPMFEPLVRHSHLADCAISFETLGGSLT
jgi:hypothetical protein